MVRMGDLEEGVDWYRDADTGDFVWTARWLAARGFCCHGGCRHCPYDSEGRLRGECVPRVEVLGIVSGTGGISE